MRLKPRSTSVISVALALAVALSAQTPTAPPVAPQPDSAMIALRAQLTEMREYRQDILNTVHWALGIAGAVAFLLVGYSWFTNSRNYERDKANMQAALKNDLASDSRALAEELRAQNKEQAQELEALAAKAAQGEAAKVSSQVSSLQSKVEALNEELLEIQIERGEEQKRGWLVLPPRLKLLEMRLNERWEMRIADELEKLSELLHKDWFTLDADEAARIMTAMDRVGSSHSADAEAIRARVKKLRAPKSGASS